VGQHFLSKISEIGASPARPSRGSLNPSKPGFSMIVAGLALLSGRYPRDH